MTRRLSAIVLAAVLLACGARAQDAARPIRIGVLTDMSGMFADISGPGAAEAVRMAVEDFGRKVLGRPIEVLTGDHQNKADLGAALARAWLDTQDVAMVNDLMNSAVALAVTDLARAKNRVAIVNGATTSALTNEACTPNSVHYTWNTYAMAHGTADAVVRQGGKTWFMIVADFAYGHQIAKDAADVIRKEGGSVVGQVLHPINMPDASSFLLQAQSSGADVVALANGGGDMVNTIKTAAEFGLTTSGRQKIVSLGLTLADTHALGLRTAQGLLLTEAWYWDLDDASRAWSKRFQARTGKMPTSAQAGDYSSTMTYLRAVQAAGTIEGDAVVRAMRAEPINDFFSHDGHIREDGLMEHSMVLMRVKSPAESKSDWDYYSLLARIAGNEAFLPLAESRCKLVHR